MPSRPVRAKAARGKRPAAAAPAAPATARAPATGSVPTSSSTPPPPATLHLTLVTLPAGRALHRVHQAKYLPAQFNPGVAGNARFSPIVDAAGQPIPTLYAGTTLACALMESVFHDVPFTAGFKIVEKTRLAGQVHATLRTREPLRLVDLASVPLRKLGITRKQLIDTEKDQYPATRRWAEAIHRHCAEAQGLTWVSRQDDRARAYVFFGDRVPAAALDATAAPRSLTGDVAAYTEVLDLAEQIGVNVVV